MPDRAFFYTITLIIRCRQRGYVKGKSSAFIYIYVILFSSLKMANGPSAGLTGLTAGFKGYDLDQVSGNIVDRLAILA